MKLGLNNIGKLLATLGDPQTKYLKVQIAGTNGKGSVCAFLDAICREAGIRTGVFTSPHLVSITERVRIDGKEISRGKFARTATAVREVSERLVQLGEIETVPTYFEQVTAGGLLAFAEAGVELALLETGLGGRFDAVTAANAEIAAITRIDLDHQKYLGNTIEAIAAEKAAIIRADSRIVIGEQREEVLDVIRARCGMLGVEPVLAQRRSTADLPEPLGLAGRHQIENAMVAASLAEILGEYFPISPEQIDEGLKNARHSGRLEIVGQYLLDGAHNGAGAKALRAFLDEKIRRPMIIVFGAMNDKDIAEMAKHLFSDDSTVVLTQPDNSRAMTAGEIAAHIPKRPGREIYSTKTVSEALSKAQELVRTYQRTDVHGEEALILVTGSLYLIGEVKAAIQIGESS